MTMSFHKLLKWRSFLETLQLAYVESMMVNKQGMLQLLIQVYFRCWYTQTYLIILHFHCLKPAANSCQQMKHRVLKRTV